jgi:hypothetical protein
MPAAVPAGLADWKDFAVLFCLALVLLGAAALAVSAQSFTLVSGKVLEIGTGVIDGSDGTETSTKTITMLISNDDRVFRIESGSVVKYAISDEDAETARVGYDVRVFVSAYSNKVRLVSFADRSYL